MQHLKNSITLTALTASAAALPLSLASAANYDRTDYDGINLGTTVTLDPTGTALIYINALEEAQNTATIFGGYYLTHDFRWEVDGDGTPRMLMLLDSASGLEVHGVGGEFIALVPGDNPGDSPRIDIGNGSTTVSLHNDAGMLKLGNGSGATTSTVVTQDTTGALNLGAAGMIAQDLTVGDGNTANPGLTVDDTLVIKHPTDSTYDALFKVEDIDYTNDGGLYTDRVVSSSRAIKVGGIVLGKHDSKGGLYTGLYTNNDRMHFVVNDGADPRDRLQLKADGVYTVTPLFHIKPWPVSDYVFSVNASSKVTEIVKLEAGSHNTALGDDAHALGHYVDADSFASVAVGRYNASKSGQSASTWVETDELFVVGNGSGPETHNRRNALVIYKSGNAEFSGTVKLHVRHGDLSMGPFAGP